MPDQKRMQVDLERAKPSRGGKLEIIVNRKEGMTGRHPKMWPNPTVGKPTMSCEKKKTKKLNTPENGKITARYVEGE